jgi:hypothetical protein
MNPTKTNVLGMLEKAHAEVPLYSIILARKMAERAIEIAKLHPLPRLI